MYYFFLDSSVVEVKYKCNDLARIDDFLEWLVEGGKFIINDKVSILPVHRLGYIFVVIGKGLPQNDYL